MSRGETIRRYAAERLRMRFVALAVVLAATGASVTSGVRQTRMRSALVAYLLVLAFRVWDDIEDREVDADHHPARVSVTGDVAALRALAIVASAAAIALMAAGPQPIQRAAGTLSLGAALLAWYRWRKSSSRSAVADAHVLLLKYPLIALIAAPGLLGAGDVARAAPLLTALYLLLCTIEWIDDPRLRRRLSPTARDTQP